MALQQCSIESALQAYIRGDKSVRVVVNTESGQVFKSLQELLEPISLCFCNIHVSNKQNAATQTISIKDEISNEDVHQNISTEGLLDFDGMELLNKNEDKKSVELIRQGDKLIVPPANSNAEYERRNKQSRRLKVDLGKMFSLKQAGWTRAQVADDLDVSYATICKYWDKEQQYLEGRL